jgi:hypothetical protein
VSAARRVHYCRDCRGETEQAFLFADARAPSENGRHPKIEWFRCERCDLLLCQMADVTDVEGLILHVLGERFGRGKARRASRGDGGTVTVSAGVTPVGDPRSTIGREIAAASGAGRLGVRSGDRWLDLEDALGHLREAALVVYRKWEPERGVPFAAYATGELRNDLVDWIRVQIGRDKPKPFANAVALDALGAAGGGGGDEDGGADAGDDRGGLDALVGHGAVDGSERGLPDLAWAVSRRRGALAAEGERLGVRRVGGGEDA